MMIENAIIALMGLVFMLVGIFVIKRRRQVSTATVQFNREIWGFDSILWSPKLVYGLSIVVGLGFAVIGAFFLMLGLARFM